MQRSRNQEGAGSPQATIVLIPTFNDWEALALLLEAIDRVVEATVPSRVEVLVVDDGSDREMPRDRMTESRGALSSVSLLRLRRNLGHQRAIAAGLAWLAANRSPGAVIVMDGDGEDDPSDITRLLSAHTAARGRAVVFAERHRRSEGLVFQIFYRLYRIVHHALTGIPVRVGNFSLIPREMLERLVVVSDLWNHYAAAVHSARLPMVFVPTARARRLSGRPTMNFTQLVVHGLSAMSVFGDRVGVRLLVAAPLPGVLVLCGVFVSIADGSMPEPWTTGTVLLVLAIMLASFLQMAMMVLLFAFGILGSRDSATFLPIRDAHWFVQSVETLWSGDD